MITSIVSYHIKNWKYKGHVILGFLMLIILGDMMLRPARKLAALLGVRPACFSFPLLWSDTIFLIFFFFCVILIFSDAPFFDTMTPLFIIRCGRTCYTISQIIYILITGIIIPAGFFVIQAIFFMPVISDDSWGKFWGTLAQTAVGRDAGLRISFDYNILWDYTPMEACIVSFLICVLLCILTGLFLYLFSLLGKRLIGMCILSASIILSNVVFFLNFTTFNWLCPYSWICLDQTMKYYNGSLPSVGFAITCLSVINLILMVVCLQVSRNKKMVF